MAHSEYAYTMQYLTAFFNYFRVKVAQFDWDLQKVYQYSSEEYHYFLPLIQAFHLNHVYQVVIRM
jgi:hypothetical protein